MFHQQALKSLIVSFSLLSALFLSACSEGGSKKSEQVIDSDLSEYKKASCTYQFHQGSAATPHRDRVVMTHFGKKINMGHLESVLTASAAEVIRFGEKLDVIFYKTSAYEAKNCEFLAALPWAPSDLDSKFTGSGLEGILGLYLPYRSPGLPSTNQRAAILLRRDANKWVLVHEYMHHLFQMQLENEHGHRDSKGEFLTTLKVLEGHLDAVEKYKSMSRNSNEKLKAELKKANKVMVKLNKLGIDFMKEYLLEEMAIETILGDHYDRNGFTLVVGGQRLNGAAYIIISSEKVKALLGALRKASRYFTDEMATYFTYNELAPIRNSLSAFSALESEVNQLDSRAKLYLRSKDLEYKGLNLTVGLNMASPLETDSDSTHVDAGCAHQHDGDEVLAAIQGLFQ